MHEGHRTSAGSATGPPRKGHHGSLRQTDAPHGGQLHEEVMRMLPIDEAAVPSMASQSGKSPVSAFSDRGRYQLNIEGQGLPATVRPSSQPSPSTSSATRTSFPRDCPLVIDQSDHEAVRS